MSRQDDVFLKCWACGVKNRIPKDRLDQGPKCGKCGTPLKTVGPAGGKPLAVTDADFESQVLKSPLPVLLDCWAPWCGPCRMVGPVVDELAREWQGKIRVAKLNTDENPRTASSFNIRSIPTLLVFHHGRLKETMVGALPKREIVRKMSPYLR